MKAVIKLKTLIVFDLDGTLHWTEKALVPAIQRTMHDLGIEPASPLRINALYGEPLEVFCRELLPVEQINLCEDFREGIRNYQKVTLPESGELYPGTVEMLRALRTMGFSLGVCSNASENYIDLVLETLGIAPFFSIIRGRGADGSKTGRIHEMITEVNAGLSIVVGDRYHDMRAAIENRVPGIGCVYGYGSTLEMEEAHFLANSPEEVVEKASGCLMAFEVETLLNRNRRPCPCVGITGPDTSGKTTFSAFLETFLISRGNRVQVIHLDDFHNPLNVRRKGDNEIDAYISNAFDMNRLCSKILAPARKTGHVHISLASLDLETDLFDRKVSYAIDPGTILVLEGVLLFREPLDQYIDVRIFLDTDEQEVLRRAEMRDGKDSRESYVSKYIPIQRWFEEVCDPRGRADLVIDNNNPGRPAAAGQNATRGF